MIRSEASWCHVHKVDRGHHPGEVYSQHVHHIQARHPERRVVAAVSHGDFIHTVWEWEEE